MATDKLVALSKLLSLILRHDPARFGIVLDPEGYTPLDEVLAAVRSRVPTATEADLISVVDTVEPQKQRFTVSDGEIRANYGHSFAERVAHSPMTPPATLFHGTTMAAAREILKAGLSPMRRQYVHLTTDRLLALRVGSRRGRATILAVDAVRAHSDGVAFYRANEAFWLADGVPAQYLTTRIEPPK